MLPRAKVCFSSCVYKEASCCVHLSTAVGMIFICLVCESVAALLLMDPLLFDWSRMLAAQ